MNVTCEFKEGIEGASCVLVYREYGNKTLVVEEYPQNTVFPVTLTVDGDLEKYTFAIFGRNNSDIDGRPIVTKKLFASRSTSSPSTSSPSTLSPSTPSPTVVPTVMSTGNTHYYCSVDWCLSFLRQVLQDHYLSCNLMWHNFAIMNYGFYIGENSSNLTLVFTLVTLSGLGLVIVMVIVTVIVTVIVRRRNIRICRVQSTRVCHMIVIAGDHTISNSFSRAAGKTCHHVSS